MSVKAMAIVWEADLPRAEKFILLAMADHADHNGENIYPALSTIARKTGYSYRQVVEIVNHLRKQKILIKTGTYINNVTIFHMNFNRLERLPPYKGKNHLRRDAKTSPPEAENNSQNATSYEETAHVKPSGSEKNSPPAGTGGEETAPLTVLGVKKLQTDGAETSHKPLVNKKLVNNDRYDLTELYQKVAKQLISIQVIPKTINELCERYDPNTLLTWLDLYDQAYDLKIAQGPGWLVSALTKCWDIELIKQQIEAQKKKGIPNQKQLPLPENLLEQLSDIGWNDKLDEVMQFYAAEPERVEAWLNHVQNHLPTHQKPYRAAQFRKALRNGLPAPKDTAQAQNYQLTPIIEVSETEIYADEQLSNAPTEHPNQRDWIWITKQLRLDQGLGQTKVISLHEVDGIKHLQIQASDQQSEHFLLNSTRMKNVCDAAKVIFKSQVQLDIVGYQEHATIQLENEQ